MTTATHTPGRAPVHGPATRALRQALAAVRRPDGWHIVARGGRLDATTEALLTHVRAIVPVVEAWGEPVEYLDMASPSRPLVVSRDRWYVVRQAEGRAE